MFRAGTFWRSLNKTFFASFAASTLLLLYLFFSVNFCVITNFRQVIQKKVETKVILEVPKSVTEGWVDKQETIVRLVPLIAWPMIEQKKGKPNYYSAKNQSTNGAPKYRFLRQQGLRPSRHLPDALIIGVKKSGTRALLEFIRLHPDVRAAGSEVHFFDRYYGKGFQWYRKHMPPTLEGQVTMEKTPSYFVTREAPSRVKQMNPSTRLLVVVRDPVTRAISDYTQAASKKSDAEMKRFEDLAFVNGSVWGSVNTSWGPIRIGVYTRHLERWLRHFPLHQMLFVSGERLIVDPAAEMARVQDFLGLKRVVTEKHFYFNATKGFPCLMKSEGRATPHCLGKTKGRNHPRIRPAALDRLREFYRPFNLRFYQLTDHEQSYNMDESMNSTLQETVERETAYVLVVGDDDMCGWLDQGVQIKEEHSYFDESSLNVKAPDDIKSKKWKQEKTEGKTVKEVENEIVSETGCESINDELIDMTATINDNLLLPKPFKCMFCLFNATQFNLLQHHLLKHSNEKRFNCEVCEFTTTNFKSFMKHLKLHSGVKLYECNFCEYVSIYNSSLKKHIRRHTGERPFSCMFCDYTCLQSAHLQAHVRTHTGEKPFKCKFCDYSCAVSGALAKHIKLHTKEKLYVCTVCGNSFSQSGSLKRHKLLHDKFKTYFSSGKKPFSCTYCDYTCLQMGTLKRHLRSHTGEKPYTCIFCERSFASSDTLKRHIRVHTEEKPYSCKLCEFASSSSGSLSDHVKTHTGEKPFGCKICGYLCIRSATLTRHMRRHTGEKPYKCHLCKHAFIESGALKKHLRKHEVAQE